MNAVDLVSHCDFCEEELDVACLFWYDDVDGELISMSVTCVNINCQEQVESPAEKHVPHMMVGKPEELSKWFKDDAKDDS